MNTPGSKRISTTSALSLVAVVVLVGAVFFTVNSARQDTDTRSKASTSGINYIVNPGCESNFSNWTAYQGSGARVSGGHSGSGSCKMTYSGSGGYYTIDDNPTSVLNPRQGETFTATAWVRTDNAVGKQVQLALRLRGGTTKLVNGPTYTLTSNWQQISNTTTIDTSTRTELEMYIVQLNASSGNSFQADDMSLYMGTAPASGNTYYPTATPTTSYYYPTPTKTPTPYYAPTATPTPYYVPPTPTRTPTPYYAPTATPTPYYAPTATSIPYYPTATPTPYYAPTATSVPYPSAVPTSYYPPTATPAPYSTLAKVTLLLHGIGNGGDSVNPTGQGNTNPLHTQRTVAVEVYNAQNQLVLSKQGAVIYNAGAGNFVGTIDLGTQFASGLYTVKIKTGQYLRGLVNGIQTITQGQTATLPNLTLVAGDVNGDNQINIVDYNMIVGCYSDLLPPTSCPGNNAALSDITDDGAVNQFDYNLFIRELTNLGGQ